MPQDHSALWYNLESTRHFLYSKAEADDLPKKPIHTAAAIQAAIQSVYPDLLAGHSLLEHADQQLSSVSSCVCVVIRIDTDNSIDFEQTKSGQAAALLSHQASRGCPTTLNFPPPPPGGRGK